MINFDYLTLIAFLRENMDYLIGSRLQKIQQPTRRDFLLSFRKTSESRKMYININPSCYHLCFVNDMTIKKRDITYPKKPPMFCMLLRKYLESAYVVDVRVPVYERIFEIDFISNNEFDNNKNLTLAIELMDKYSNIILYNTDTNIILGSAHNVGSEKSREREIAGNLPYIYPPKQNKSDILRYFGDVDYKKLNENFWGISKNNEKLFINLSLETIKDYMTFEKKISPAVSDENYCIYSELLDNAIYCNSVNQMIDKYYSDEQEKILFNQLFTKIKNNLFPKYKKIINSIKKIELQISKKDKAAKYKMYGDLILANLYNGQDFSNNIIVTDWKTNDKIEILLDETKTLKENAQKYYKMYSKSKNSKDKLDKLYNDLKQEKEYLEQIKYSLNIAKTLTDLKEIDNELDIKPKEIKQQENEIETIDINNFTVYIGKNNRQNDLIVSKLSKGEDYWFHAHNMPGSHILLKIIDKQKPDDATILECCKLAKKYSSGANSSKVGIIYTQRKFLKKPPASKLGYVIYKNETEIIID